MKSTQIEAIRALAILVVAAGEPLKYGLGQLEKILGPYTYQKEWEKTESLFTSAFLKEQADLQEKYDKLHEILSKSEEDSLLEALEEDEAYDVPTPAEIYEMYRETATVETWEDLNDDKIVSNTLKKLGFEEHDDDNYRRQALMWELNETLQPSDPGECEEIGCIVWEIVRDYRGGRY